MIEFWVVQTPLQTPMQTPLPGTVQTPLPGTAQTPLPGNDNSPLYNISTGGTPMTPNDFASPSDNGGVPEMKGGLGRPSQFMVSPSFEICLLLDFTFCHIKWSMFFF